MLYVKEAAEILDITPARLKQIIKESDYPVIRERNNYINIPTDIFRKIRISRGWEPKCVYSTVGIEKGGVGKTIITLNLAVAATKRGLRVAILDLDPEACSTLFLAEDDTDFDGLGTILEVFNNDIQIVDLLVKSRFDGIDYLASKTKIRRVEKYIGGRNPKTLLKDKLKGIDKKYDLVLFDLPPSYFTLQQAAYLSSDIIIIPVNNDVFSLDSLNLTLEDLEETSQEFEAKLPPIYVLRNRYQKTRRNAKETTQELMKEHGDKVLPFQIKDCAAITNALNDGATIFDAPSEADIRSSFMNLLDHINSPVN